MGYLENPENGSELMVVHGTVIWRSGLGNALGQYPLAHAQTAEGKEMKRKE